MNAHRHSGLFTHLALRLVALAGIVVLALAVVDPPVAASSGVQLVLDIRGGSAGSAPAFLTAVGDRVFFTANDATHGRELWVSDDTTGGTHLVRDIRQGSTSSYPKQLTAADGRLFFVATDAAHGRELWVSDGTTSGTHLTRDIHQGKSGSYPDELTDVAGTLYALADDGVTGQEIWRSDGTWSGTRLLKDIEPGRFGSSGFGLAGVGSTLYWDCCQSRSQQLWRSDGTAAGTRAVVRPGPQHPWLITDVAGTAYFVASDQRELWKSNGTAAGTLALSAPQPGNAGFQDLTAVGSRLFMVRNPDTSGDGGPDTLWTSDGTIGGTTEIAAPDGTPEMQWLTAVGDTLYFVVVRFTGSGPYYGWDREIWSSDGTGLGTKMVSGGFYASNTAGGQGSPLELTAFDGQLYFVADRGYGLELWRSDGTDPGTVDELTPAAADGQHDLTVAGGLLFFSMNDGNHGDELWSYAP